MLRDDSLCFGEMDNPVPTQSMIWIPQQFSYGTEGLRIPAELLVFNPHGKTKESGL